MRNPTFELRPIQLTDEPFMWEMLLESVYVPDGQPRPAMDLVKTVPELQHYAADWGRPHDFGYIAVETESGKPIGAAWLRLFDADQAGFGFVDADTPELSTIAVVPAWRGRGVGTALLQALLVHADARYQTISLSCDPRNPALRLYQRLGFHKVGESGTSDTLLRQRSR